MAFDVIPAIDTFGGRLARFTRSGPEPVTAHDGDPLTAAQAFVDAGASWLHVVDLDLAFTGVHAGLEALRAISALGVPVQAAGAVITLEEIHAALDAGAARVVLGSGALLDLDAAVEAIAREGERLVVGIEVEGDRIRARGRDVTDLPLEETLRAVADAGAARLLVTGVARVGTSEGPDLGAVGVAVTCGVPVLAAGGIGGSRDLAALRDCGAEGAVVGRAALEGGMDLSSAITALA